MEQVDYKARAAGEKPLENENDDMQQRQEKILAYAAEVLEYLIMFTRAELEPKDQEVWIQRLSKVPPWKLKRLDEFTSPFINEVWKFFDSLQQPPQTYEPIALPEPKSNIAKDSLAHIKAILSFEGSKKEKRAFEKKGLKELHRKYPTAGFDEAIRMRGL